MGGIPEGLTRADEQRFRTCNHEREVETLLDRLAVHLVGKRCETHVFFVLVLQRKQK